MYCESAGSATSQARLCAARSASRQLLALLQCRALAVTVTSCIQSNSSRSHLHPFREGNGRSQRAFFHQLADQAGYVLDGAYLEKHYKDFNTAREDAMLTSKSDQLAEFLKPAVQPKNES